MKYEIANIGHGKTGWDGWGYNSHLSGYGSSLEHVAERLVEGGLIVDNTAAPFEKLAIEARNGPMLGVYCGREDYNKAPRPSPELIAGLQGSYKDLAQNMQYQDYIGMDEVGAAIYIRRRLAIGAKLYRVENGQAVERTLEEVYESLPVLLGKSGARTAWRIGDRIEFRHGDIVWRQEVCETEEEALVLLSK